MRGSDIYTALAIAAAVTIWNAVTFAVYGADKRHARKGRQRVSEHTLLLMAAWGGSLGALLGMRVFHHKTRKPAFRKLVPLFLILHLVLAVCLIHGATSNLF